MSVTKITFADIEKAANIDDVDVALKGLQDIAGITDGGIAGIVFSDIDWKKESIEERHKILIHYLRVERRYEEQD